MNLVPVTLIKAHLLYVYSAELNPCMVQLLWQLVHSHCNLTVFWWEKTTNGQPFTMLFTHAQLSWQTRYKGSTTSGLSSWRIQGYWPQVSEVIQHLWSWLFPHNAMRLHKLWSAELSKDVRLQNHIYIGTEYCRTVRFLKIPWKKGT
jgi:hypothetical protein